MVRADDGAVARAHHLAALQAGSGRRIQLGLHVRQKQHLRRWQAQAGGDGGIAGRVALGADAGVEEPGEQGHQVARIGMAEQQPLRLNRPGRVHEQPQPCLRPPAQAGGHVGIQLALHGPAGIGVAPQDALQRLQRRRLHVAVHPVQQGRQAVRAGYLGQRRRDLRLRAAVAHQGRQSGAGLREQHIVQESDRRRRALDVGDDRRDDGQATRPGTARGWAGRCSAAPSPTGP